MIVTRKALPRRTVLAASAQASRSRCSTAWSRPLPHFATAQPPRRPV